MNAAPIPTQYSPERAEALMQRAVEILATFHNWNDEIGPCPIDINSPWLKKLAGLCNTVAVLEFQLQDANRTAEDWKTEAEHHKLVKESVQTDRNTWKGRTLWMLDHAKYSGGGNGGTYNITFTTPLDSECEVSQLDAAIKAAPSPA